MGVRGQIRPDFGSREWVVSYEFRLPVFDPIEGKTIFYPFLGAVDSATLRIPQSKVKGDNYEAGQKNVVDASAYKQGQNCWVTDIEMFNPTDPDLVRKIYRAFVLVLPEATIDG